MEATTQGVVLRKLPYTGSSMIVSIYTRRFGHTTFMAKGAGRKGGSISKAAFEPLSRVEVLCTFRENRQMQTLKSIRLDADTAFYINSPEKATVAMFIAEVLYKTLREEASNEDLFDFIDQAVIYFVREAFQPDFHLLFLMHMTKYFGFFPSGKWEERTPWFDLQEGTFAERQPHTSVSLDRSRSMNFSKLALAPIDGEGLGITGVDRRLLLADLLRYYEFHLDGMGKIKSLTVLTEVFS